VGRRAVLDAVVKRKIPSPRRESNHRTPIVQPVAQGRQFIVGINNISVEGLSTFCVFFGTKCISERVMVLVKKFPTFYGTRNFITVFTTACHCFLL
jgi:hypothetical protein